MSKPKLKSLKDLRREKRRKQSPADYPPLSLDGCDACYKKNECPSAEKLLRLKRNGNYSLKKPQDEAVWLPQLEGEKHTTRNDYRNIRLCEEYEKHANQDFIPRYWKQRFNSLSNPPV